MAALVAAIPVGKADPFPIEMAGESSPHAASVFDEDGRAKRAVWPAMTTRKQPPPLDLHPARPT
jgi:hypothetical protein